MPTWAMSFCVWTSFVPQPDRFSLALKDLWATHSKYLPLASYGKDVIRHAKRVKYD